MVLAVNALFELKLPSRSRVMLLMRDDPQRAELALALDRYDIVLVDSTESALAQMVESTFAVVIAASDLPDGSGIDLLLRALAVQPHLGRILLAPLDAGPVLTAAVNQARVHGIVTPSTPTSEIAALVAKVASSAGHALVQEHEHRTLFSLAVDDRTGLPTRVMAQAQAAAWLRHGGFLGALAIDASEIWATQLALGQEYFTQLSAHFLAILHDMQGRFFRAEDLLVIDEVESPYFCVFLAHPREERVSCAHDVERIAVRVQTHLTRELARRAGVPGESCPRVAVGHGFALWNPHLSELSLIRQAIDAARETARQILLQEQSARKSQLQRIILDQQIKSVFQPIFALRDKSVLGYEALSRGPADTEFESPAFLLSIADSAGLTVELDRVFRAQAFENAQRLPKESKIFVNTLPSTVYDPELRASRLTRNLERLAIDPRRVVLEFSERYVVPNQRQLSDALKEQRALGIELAIDDVGTGYSGLERIATLEPDYLKIDQSLVRHVATRGVKRSVVTALVRMAEDIGAAVVAEGIETEDERLCLIDMGVHFGQGFHLARPQVI